MRVYKLFGWATAMRVHQVSYMGTCSHVWPKRQGTKKARVRDEQLTDALRSGLPPSLFEHCKDGDNFWIGKGKRTKNALLKRFLFWGRGNEG